MYYDIDKISQIISLGEERISWCTSFQHFWSLIPLGVNI